MKYFTDELWSKRNSSYEKDREEAKLKWNKNLQDYWDTIKLLSNRLSRKTCNIIENHSFHDFRLVKLELIHGKQGSLNPIEIHLVVTDQVDIWNITYKRIKKFSMNFESDYLDRYGFDDWGYDELLIVDEDTLSHEILFASGATLLIHFKNKNLYITKVKL